MMSAMQTLGASAIAERFCFLPIDHDGRSSRLLVKQLIRLYLRRSEPLRIQ